MEKDIDFSKIARKENPTKLQTQEHAYDVGVYTFIRKFRCSFLGIGNKKRTKDSALAIIVQTGLAETTDEAEDILENLTGNYLPKRALKLDKLENQEGKVFYQIRDHSY